MALNMNSVGIPGGLRVDTGFSGKFGVWGCFGRFGASKGFCANSQVSLSKCPFRETNFVCTRESPRNFPSHSHENDTCAVTPCTAMHGQNKCLFL